VQRGHTVTVLTIAKHQLQRIDLRPTGETRAPIAELRDWGWRSWGTIIAALDQLRPDLLHIQYQTGAYEMRPAVNLLPWRLHALPTRPAVAVTAHDLLPPYLFPKAGPLRDWVTRRMLTDADAAVVTNEEDFSQLAARRLKPGRLELIPIGSNIAVAPPQGYERGAWRAKLGVAPSETLVAFFGLISRTKGFDTLLDALGKLPTSVRLLVVGGQAPAPQDHAYAETMRRRIATVQLAGRVQITGQCTDEEVSAHLLAADLAALPFGDGASFRRGSLLAALAHGLPVVTTWGHTTKAEGRRQKAEYGSFAPGELVDGVSALLVLPGDAGALAKAIARLAADAGLRQQIGEGGRNLAAHVSWEAIAERHAALYRTIRRDTLP
jgi:glycosyltransferase involved in cell wall biosynthesis